MRFVWILILVLAGVTAGALFTRFERDAPSIQARTQTVYVGQQHTHEFRIIDDGMGIESVHIWLSTGGKQHELYSETYAGSLFLGAQLKQPRRVEVTIRPEEFGIESGRGTIFVEARDYSWAGNYSALQIPLVIDTRPPRISLQTGLTYVRRGGTELVVYQVDEEVERHGVELSENFFPGLPHPRDPSRYVALYALPPNTLPNERPRVVALDKAGNQTGVTVSISIIEIGFPDETIALSEDFMRSKVAELMGGEPDDLLGAFLKINGEMRREAAAEITEICKHSSDEQLWSGPFVQLPNSRVNGRFAERRTYQYQGEVVDHQTHLGYDFASTARAEIPAANDGVVRFVGDLGIYGNTVIIDHGLSFFTLYGHLSEISVEKGDAVSKSDVIGRTGSTGLAGGDHLHFSTLVNGVFVDPLEWFDAGWIQEHIEVKLAVNQTSNS
jgi:murein DD-endopeptidase MepM/ murein hydrolase activator NlpD